MEVDESSSVIQQAASASQQQVGAAHTAMDTESQAPVMTTAASVSAMPAGLGQSPADAVVAGANAPNVGVPHDGVAAGLVEQHVPDIYDPYDDDDDDFSEEDEDDDGEPITDDDDDVILPGDDEDWSDEDSDEEVDADLDTGRDPAFVSYPAVRVGVGETRGPIMFVLPGSEHVVPVESKSRHFQTADALVVVPPRSSSQPSQHSSWEASTSGTGTGASKEAFEVMVGGRTSLSLYRMYADTDGQLQHSFITEAPLDTSHYSLSASPCGSYLAAGGDRGKVYIFGYAREPGMLPALIPLAVCNIPSGRRSEAMVNCVRYGTFDGQMRLIVTSQEQHIYILAVPPWSGSRNDLPPPRAFLVPPPEDSALRRWPRYSTTRSEPTLCLMAGKIDVMLPKEQTGAQRTSPDAASMPACETLTIGMFAAPLNCTEPSPDGQYLAVAEDRASILIIPCGTDFLSRKTACLDIPPVGHGQRNIYDLREACQYCRWNTRSDMLAASSDSLQAVYVYSVPSNLELKPHLIYSFGQHSKPCLALCWSPTDPCLLVYALEAGAVYFKDFACAEQPLTAQLLLDPKAGSEVNLVHYLSGQNAGMPPQVLEALLALTQGLPLPAPVAHMQVNLQLSLDALKLRLEANERQQRQQRVNGLAITSSGRLLVAMPEQLVAWQLMRHSWDLQHHKHTPPAFQAAVRAVLQLAHLDPVTGQPRHPSAEVEQSGEEQTGLWALPKEVLLKVLGFALHPQHVWVGKGQSKMHGRKEEFLDTAWVWQILPAAQ